MIGEQSKARPRLEDIGRKSGVDCVAQSRDQPKPFVMIWFL